MGFQRVLSIHNSYQIPGGEDNSCKAERQLLKEMGHEVVEYNADNHHITNLGSKVSVALQSFWSRHSYSEILEILKARKVDIVHVQNFFPTLSPSVFYAAKDAGVPVVFTIRNYRLICANGLLFREGSPCELCINKPTIIPAIYNRCYRDSALGSAVVGSLSALHRRLGTWTKTIDLSIVLTEFAKSKFIESGWPEDRLYVKPNFMFEDSSVSTNWRRSIVFAGRFSKEKGVLDLLNAWKKIKTNGFSLELIGDGPLLSDVLEGIRGRNDIVYRGRMTNADLITALGEASLVAFPSKWYEGMPRTIIEAFSKGVPVMAENIGAMGTMIENGVTGLTYESGNLANCLEGGLANPENIFAMRAACRNEYEVNYTKDANYQMLLEAYARANFNNGLR